MVSELEDRSSPPHAVEFYRDDAALAARVAEFIGTGLSKGAPVVVIATQAHCRQFRSRLAEVFVDADAACKSGLLRFYDAEETLAELMVGDRPDWERFRRLVGRLLDPAGGRRVYAYGEMVDLLVRRGNRDAAMELEQLWNRIARVRTFSLLCGYKHDSFDGEERACFEGVHNFSVEERLHESEGHMRLLIDSIRDYAIFMLDADGRVTSWNPGAARLKGYQAHDIIGRHFSTFYPEEDVKAGKCERELEVAAEIGRFEDEGWRVRKDGTQFWANVVISAVRDGDGRLLGFAKVTRDLTDRKRAEEERVALTAAKRASRAKDEFLAMLGHELRNPLAPIVTALQLMKLRGDSGNSSERVVIERQVQHMVRLVDDLLDVSRITQGKIELRKDVVELVSVVAKAVEIASPLIEQKRHQLSVDVPRTGMRLDADPVRLIQVLANLLTNAAKYTEPEGRIGLDAWRDGHEVVIRVQDNGVGISPELLPRLFDLFVQGDGSADRAQGGLGIGLTLVRTLTQMHGGTVTALSDGPGRGSAFVVRLHALPDNAPPPPERASRELKSVCPRRVLLVDDNQDAASLMAELVGAMGHEVRVAHDGPQALAALAGFTPEVAVLDIGLPVMDGYELASRLRDQLGSGCRLIALTGYAQEHDRRRSEESGFESHLVKPVDPGHVLRMIDEVSRAGRSG